MRNLYAGQEATVRTGHGTTDWFQLGKGVCFPGGSEVKVSACNVGDLGLILVSGRFPWSRKWQPTPVFLPGEFWKQRSLVSYSPWGYEKLDVSEHTYT